LDTITHALSGALLGRATKDNTSNSGLSLRVRILVGTLAAAFPDIDFIARFFGLISYLETHRGITHSFVLLPFWALLLAYVFSKLSKGRYQWRDFYFVCASGLAIHILGDVITAYGTMIFSPVSDAKFSWPTTFIIDLYFTGIIVVALIATTIFRQQGKNIAIVGLCVLISYIAYQASLHHDAKKIAQTYAEQKNLEEAKIYVMPQPLSPFHWKAIIKSSETYYISYINLKSKFVFRISESASLFEKIKNIYRPVNKLQWMAVKQYGNEDEKLSKQIWYMDFMKSVRQFMLYPVVDSIVKLKDKKCIWFKDHRFVLDGVRAGPFRFGACKGQQSHWKPYHLLDDMPVPLFK